MPSIALTSDANLASDSMQVAGNGHLADQSMASSSDTTHGATAMTYMSGPGSTPSATQKGMNQHSATDGPSLNAMDDHMDDSEVAGPIGAMAEMESEEENIDAILGGWTDSGEFPSEENSVAIAVQPVVDQSQPQATVESPSETIVATSEIIFGLPDLGTTLDLPVRISDEGDSRFWSVSGAVGLALASALGAVVLERRAANAQSVPASTRLAMNASELTSSRNRVTWRYSAQFDLVIHRNLIGSAPIHRPNIA